MDLKIVKLSEVSQMQKDKYHMIRLICGILKKKRVQNRIMDVENKIIVTREDDKLGDWD